MGVIRVTKIKDILRLRDDIIFGGAVQTDWYYENKSEKISENFVFHGPDFHGVTQEDVEYKNHKLMDTASYTNLIADRLYKDEGNPILMTIAGYGTGKSHLSVTLGKLFSTNKDSEINKKILNNINKVSLDISKEIASKIDKPNLVIVLNGMKDFNLNYEILINAKKILKGYGYGEEFFSEFTKAYSIAQIFLARNFYKFKDDFIMNAKKFGIEVENYKEYMIENIYKDEVFDSVNEVYKDITGEYIRWDEGISASEVLKKLVEKLCGEKGDFNKVLILFDEFGRYIEYASEYPNRAGDSALQQVFEAIQDSNNNIIFVGFIQSDLKTYLSRVNKSSNISRYIGRYESGEKIYLSSNLETIFANLLEKYDRTKFVHYIEGYFNKNSVIETNKKLFDKLGEWISSTQNKGIWSDWNKFNGIVIKGIYPLNPITTWIITYLSDWYQQRSALNFLLKSFPNIENEEITELGDLPQILPIDIIKGEFFKEFLLAETEGRQKSEYCILYDKILTRLNDKLNLTEKDVLAGILILKLGKFRTKEYSDVILALEYILNKNASVIEKALKDIEETFGVISYDTKNCTYDFIEDATGINDFNRFIKKKKNEVINVPLELLLNADIIEKLGLNSPVLTDFNIKNNIKTSEWQFDQEMVPISRVDRVYIKNLIEDFKNRTSPDKAKGKLIYLYNHSSFGLEYVNKITELYTEYKLEEYPFIFSLIDDKNDTLFELLIEDNISKRFTEEEKMKYAKFIVGFNNRIDEEIKDIFTGLIYERLIINNSGVNRSELRLSRLCNKVFEDLYPKVIPFPFDGFNNKIISASKKIHANIAKSIMSNMVNYQWVQTQTKDVRNRLDIVLKNASQGWGTLDQDLNIVYPKNPKVKQIFSELDKTFYDEGAINLNKVYKEYTQAPYGLNDYSFSMIIAIYIVLKGIEGKLVVSDQIKKSPDWAAEFFNERNLDFKLLECTIIRKINIEGYKAKFQNICVKIERNNDVDECPNLNEELQKLLMESDPPEEYREKVEGCKLILTHGIRLCEKINRFIAKNYANLSNGIENEDYKYILGVISDCEGLGDLIDSDDTYTYNNRHLSAFEEMSKKARDYVETHYEKYIKNVKCNSIAQVTRFENWMKILRDELRKIGYPHFANITNERLINIVDNLDTIREQQMVIEASKKFLSNVNPGEFSSQEELLEWKKEAEKLIEYLEKNEFISKNDRMFFVKPVSERLSRIQLYLDKITNLIMDIQDRAYELNDLVSARKLMSDIEYLLSKKLRQVDKEDVELIGNVLQNLFRDIKKIESLDKLTTRVEEAQILKETYKENEEVVNVNELVDDYVKTLQNEIEDLNDRWKKDNINFELADINEWNSNKCLTWLKSTEVLPYYLYNEIVDECFKLRDIVEIRVEDLKIESIMVIFNGLTPNEKKKCLEMLSEYSK